jgi:hypothetical protein
VGAWVNTPSLDPQSVLQCMPVGVVLPDGKQCIPKWAASRASLPRSATVCAAPVAADALRLALRAQPRSSRQLGWLKGKT